MRRTAVVALLLIGSAAVTRAAVSCDATVSAPSGPYAYTTPLTLGGTLTVHCTKGAEDAIASTPFSATVVTTHDLSAQDNSAHAIGYGLWRNSNGSSLWGSTAPNAISGSVVYSNGPMASAQSPFYVVVPARVQIPAAGSYQDGLLVSLAYSPDAGGLTSATASAASTVTLNVAPSCSLSLPATLTLNYQALQPGPSNASTGFTVSCNTSYTLSLDATQGTLLGLPYTLALDAASGIYDGLAHSRLITGSIAGGLAGACAGAPCQATQMHILTVSY